MVRSLRWMDEKGRRFFGRGCWNGDTSNAVRLRRPWCCSNKGLRQRFAAEAQTVGKELTDPATWEIFFRTPAGKAVLAQIQSRFDEGFDVTPAEHVRHMAMAEAMPIYLVVATKQAATIVELQNRLSRYEKAQPNQGGAAGLGSGQNVAFSPGQAPPAGGGAGGISD